MAGHRRKLDSEEWAILTVLSQNEDRPEERTAPRIATMLRCNPDDVADALAKLEREGLVLSVDDPASELVWLSTSPDAWRTLLCRRSIGALMGSAFLFRIALRGVVEPVAASSDGVWISVGREFGWDAKCQDRSSRTGDRRRLP